jgi:hypothetical protein
MELYLLIVILILGVIVTYGTYLTITTVADKFFVKQRLGIRAKNNEMTLPLRLQAYERMCLFLERITPGNLLLRLTGSAANAMELQTLLLHEIREEYNHNLAQQIYMSTDAWDQITNAMNEVISIVNKASAIVSGEAPPTDLAKTIMAQVIEKEIQPSTQALKFIKNEVQMLFK